MSDAACPLCQSSASRAPQADFPGAWQCVTCKGVVLQQDASVRVIERLGVEPSVISTLTGETGQKSRLSCVNGDGPLAKLPVKGAQLRVCLRCGTSVFPAGHLEPLWQGQLPPPSLSGAKPARQPPMPPPPTWRTTRFRAPSSTMHLTRRRFRPPCWPPLPARRRRAAA